MKTSQLILAAALVLVIAVSSGLSGYSIGKARSRDSVFERFHKFKKYEREHPEQFKKMMEHRRGEIRERLAKLREKDPAKYKEIIQSQIDRMESTLAELKKDLSDSKQGTK